MSRELRMDGRVAFVTGAARGQGRSHAIGLAAEGADLILLDACEDQTGTAYAGPTEADLEETARLVEALGRRVVARTADVRDLSQVRAVVDQGVEALGRLDVVVANAGIAAPPHRTHEVPEEAFIDMLDVNLVGVWRTAAVSVPHIRSGGRGGSIILTSSVAGAKGMPNSAPYVSAKHGVVGLMKVMALELAEDMIRVNSVLPTTVDTPMVQNQEMYRLFQPGMAEPDQNDFAQAARGLNTLPVPWVESVDLTHAVLFLASDESRYITGVPLPVDAGALLK